MAQLVQVRKRGFEPVTGNESVEMPKRSTAHSAGYDFKSLNNVSLGFGECYVFNTGIKAYMQEDEVLSLFIRSSLAIKRKLKLVNQTGIVDSDYYNNPNNEGVILICLENTGKEVVSIKAGEKIAQGVFQKFLTTDDDTADGERLGGVGSTGL